MGRLRKLRGLATIAVLVLAPPAAAAGPKAGAASPRAIEQEQDGGSARMPSEPPVGRPAEPMRRPDTRPLRQPHSPVRPKEDAAPLREGFTYLRPVVETWSFVQEPSVGQVGPGLLAPAGILTFDGRGFGDAPGSVQLGLHQVDMEPAGWRDLLVVEWTPTRVRARMAIQLKGPLEPTSTPLRLRRADGQSVELAATTQLPTYVRALGFAEMASASCYQSECVHLPGRPALSTRHTIPAGRRNVVGRDFWTFTLDNGCVFERMPAWNAQVPPYTDINEDYRFIRPDPGNGPELSPPTAGTRSWQLKIDWMLQGGDTMTYAAEVDVRCPKGIP